MEEWPQGFDLAALLAPLPGDAPAGRNLRSDSSPTSLYYRLRDARSEARAEERRRDRPPDPTLGEMPASTAAPPQWGIIRELGIEAIGDHSKDLEIAVWLTEALLRTDALIGLTAGIRLMTGLVEGFWDDLFPLPDEDGISTRVGAVTGLNGQSGDGTLIQPIGKIALFERPDGAPFQLWEYEGSLELARITDPEIRQQWVKMGRVPFETVEDFARIAEDNASKVGRLHFAELRAGANAALAAWKALGDALDVRAGAESPPSSRVREKLEKIAEFGARFAAPEEAAVPGQADAPPEGSTARAVATGAAPAGLAAAGAVASREEALRALAMIADYFRRTEPMSPLSYTLQDALRRARMSWPELLAEIVPDIGVRSAILTSLGIRPPPSE